MSYFFLIPVSIGLGLAGLFAFFWALRHDQYDDLKGAAARILMAPDAPVKAPPGVDRPRDQLPARADRPAPGQTP